MLNNYFPILLFIIVSIIIGALPILVSRALNKGEKNEAKSSAYECGFENFSDARMKFDIRFYLVAILFIIFDLEIAFLFPWAVALKSLGVGGLISMSIFLLILIIGFIYEWKKGALNWD
jgi:NADH-quinone oxidoreductase subunit A